LRSWQSKSKDLARVYGNLWLDIETEARLLGVKIENGEYTVGTVQKSDDYKRLMTAVVASVLGFQSLTLTSARELQTGAINFSYADVQRLVRLQAPNIDFFRPQAGAMEVLNNYLAQGSPLWTRINGLSSYGADKVTQAILDSIRAGNNATITAANIRKAFSIPLTDSLRITRTVTAYSYREANRLQYMTNPQAVSGWQWFSALEPGRTCMSCVNLHGTIHPADEVQNDHHSGLCTSLPVVVGRDAPLTESGEEWFYSQSAEIQQSMMGKGMYAQWSAGNINIGDMTREYQDEVYGTMLRQSTLQELIGN